MTEALIKVSVGDPQNAVALAEMVEERLSSLENAAPSKLGLDIKRMARGCYLAVLKNDDLQRCTPKSLFLAMLDAARYGIDPSGPHGKGYLIPYGRTAKFMPGYKGMMSVARKVGMVKDIRAGIVVDGETFEVDLANCTLRHVWRPDLDHTDESKFVAAYAIAWPTNGERPAICVLDRSQVEARRACGNSGFWKKWPDRQWRKTAIRTLFNGGEIELDPTFEDLLEYDQSLEEEEIHTITLDEDAPNKSKALIQALRDEPPADTEHTPDPVDVPPDMPDEEVVFGEEPAEPKPDDPWPAKAAEFKEMIDQCLSSYDMLGITEGIRALPEPHRSEVGEYFNQKYKPLRAEEQKKERNKARAAKAGS